MRKVIQVLCCVALLCASALWAQNMAQVKGTVIDQNGKPMVGAKVELKNLENKKKEMQKPPAENTAASAEPPSQ